MNSNPSADTRTDSTERPFALRVARVRHDLQNPIGHILGFGEMLIEEALEQGLEAARADLDLINHTAAQMIAQLREHLDPHKIESNQSDLPGLQQRLAESASQIIAATQRLAGLNCGDNADVFKSDLARIAGAAEQTRTLAQTSLTRLSTSSATRSFQTEFLANPLAALLRLGTEPHLPFTQKEGDLLVVDDLEQNRALLSRRLSRLGYSVQVAESGASALEFVAAHPVDVILLDIMMPSMNGLEVLQRLKSNPATRHIPVVMLSTADETNTVVRCIQMGAEDFLPKPFNTTLLMARIESSLARKRLRDQENTFLKRLQAEQETSERLLLNILPKPIAERLKRGEQIIADSLPEVTVLFSDFVGFTPLSAELTPKDLVARLNNVFSIFDHLCETHGLEKIKMIGDAYMVVGGAPTPRDDHAPAVAELALAMQREVQRLRAEGRLPLHMRIGLNTGPAVAGVIGIKKFAYDLWGDTVNLASRMEGHAPADGILVTAATFEKLRDRYRFEAPLNIQVKGKGDVLAYSLLGKSREG